MTKPFSTPANEISFGGLVDMVVAETGRTSALRSVAAAVNATVRECQAFGFLARDVQELVVPVGASPFTWERPPYFRSLQGVKYPFDVYPRLRRPGRAQDVHQESHAWYYAVDNYYAFNGVSIGDNISIAAAFWAKPLLYQNQPGVDLSAAFGVTAQTRTAYFDQLTDVWMYLQADGTSYDVTSPDIDGGEMARKNAANWIILDWFDMVKEGAKAKVWNTYGDGRATASYATYTTNRKLFEAVFEAEVSAQ